MSKNEFNNAIAALLKIKFGDVRKMKPNKRFLVAIDDGHGMDTAGKRTPKFKDGRFMYENEFNRAVAELLKIKLEEYGVETIMAALGDEDISLKQRTVTANEAKADLFVSIHANAYKGVWGNHGGIETFHYYGSVKGKKAAQIIHKHLIQGTQLRDRGIKEAGFYVLKYTRMPAILVECGFMDSVTDAKLLLTGAYREECASEICSGISEYFDIENQVDWKEKYSALMKRLKELVK